MRSKALSVVVQIGFALTLLFIVAIPINHVVDIPSREPQ